RHDADGAPARDRSPRDGERHRDVPDRGRSTRRDPIYREQRHLHDDRHLARPGQFGDDRADEFGDSDAPHAELRFGDRRSRRPNDAPRVDQRAAVMRVAIVLLAACGDGLLAPDARPSDARALRPDAPVDAAIDTMPDANPFTPPNLFLTGLCLDLACAQISPE